MTQTGHLLKTIILAATVNIFTCVTDANANTIIKRKCPAETRLSVCAQNGGIEHIFIYGEIDDETAIKVAQIDGAIPVGKPFPPIYVNSDGGDIEAAMWIGRILRRRGATIEGRDAFFPDNGASCASACVLIAAGAVVRQFRDIGLHRTSIVHKDGRGRVEVRAGSEASMQAIFNYLDEMGIPPAIRTYIASTPHDDMTYLTYDAKKPHDQQPIVALGFRMSPDDEEKEPKRVSGLLTLTDDTAELQAGADAGDARAAHQLAKRFFYGTDGEDKDVTQAMRYFERAVELGNIQARHTLGVIFSNGWGGVAVDKERAFKHYLIAAQAGYSGSQNNLAFAYFQGAGVEQNIPEAVYWATRSAEQGEPFAYSTLGEMRFAGVGFPADDVETFKWLKLAVTKMPDGKGRQYDAELLAKVVARMTDAQYQEGWARFVGWKPLKQTMSLMGDKGE